MKPSALTRFRAQNIGFIFQSFNLIPTLNVLENVTVPMLIRGHSQKEAAEHARAILTEVGLGNRCSERPNNLSGGQQQRVAIARALVHKPKLIICDEPTSALDKDTGQHVMEILSSVGRAPGRCVIVVTHDNRIFKYADRMTEMDDGRVQRVHANPSKDFAGH